MRQEVYNSISVLDLSIKHLNDIVNILPHQNNNKRVCSCQITTDTDKTRPCDAYL